MTETDIPLLGSGDIGAFVRGRLANPEREGPLVVISPAWGSRRYLVSPVQVIERVGDLAEVVLLRDESAARALSQIVGKRLSCYWGAVRVYWPKFDSRRSWPPEHPVWIADQIKNLGPQGFYDDLVETLREGAPNRAPVPGARTALFMRPATATPSSEKRTAELQTSVGELAALVVRTERERDAALARADAAERDRKELSARADRAEDENASLRDQIAQLERSQRNIALDPESVYRFFAQRKASFSLVSGDEPSGDLADIYRDVVKALGGERDKAVVERDAARGESAAAQDAIAEERGHRLAAESQRDEGLEGAGQASG